MRRHTECACYGATGSAIDNSKRDRVKFPYLDHPGAFSPLTRRFFRYATDTPFRSAIFSSIVKSRSLLRSRRGPHLDDLSGLSPRHVRPAALCAGLCLSALGVATRAGQRRAAVAAHHAAGKHEKLRGHRAAGGPRRQRRSERAARLVAGAGGDSAGRASRVRLHRVGAAETPHPPPADLSERIRHAAARWPCDWP